MTRKELYSSKLKHKMDKGRSSESSRSCSGLRMTTRTVIPVPSRLPGLPVHHTFLQREVHE